MATPGLRLSALRLLRAEKASSNGQQELQDARKRVASAPFGMHPQTPESGRHGAQLVTVGVR